MRNHLLKMHSIAIDCPEDIIESGDDVDDTKDNADKTKKKANKEKLVQSLILQLLIKSYIPFKMVESYEFLELIRLLDPRFKVPSKWCFTNKILDDKYKDTVNKIVQALSYVDSVGVTLDAWTSCQPYPYLGNSLTILNCIISFLQ